MAIKALAANAFLPGALLPHHLGRAL